MRKNGREEENIGGRRGDSRFSVRGQEKERRQGGEQESRLRREETWFRVNKKIEEVLGLHKNVCV